MKKIISIYLLFLIIFSSYSKDILLKAKITARQFYKESDKIILDASSSEYPKNKKVSFLWEIKDINNKIINLPTNNTEKIEITLPEGKYIATLTISLNKKDKNTTDFTFYVASKEDVNVTFKIIAPENTKEDETLFLAHEVPNHSEWLPYATMLTKDKDGFWTTTLNLKTGRYFKFQPTKGSWANKARDNNNNDFIITYIPYREEEVIIKDFSWGRIFDDKTLIRQPLLVPIKEDFLSFKILWNTQENNLFYGEEGKEEKEANVIKYEYGYEAILENLKPATTYYFKLGKEKEKIVFKTLSPTKELINFVAIADSQNKPKLIEQGAKKIATYNPDFVISAGDNINDGLKAFSWDLTFFTPFVPNIKGIPFITAMGNHEESSPLVQRYLSIDKTYSAYTISNLKILIIDSEISFLKGSKQYDFIETVLKNNKSKWIIVVMHESPYSFVPRHYSNLLTREILSPLFEKYRVDLVLSGHNHVYERTKKINGITYITLPSFGSNKPSKSNEQKDLNSEIQVYDKDGFAVITVSKNEIKVRIESIEGDIIDSFSITK